MPAHALHVDTDPAELGFDPTRLNRVADRLGTYLSAGLFAGYSVAVGRHGKVAYVHKAGHADREAGQPIADDTVFRIYSMTKPITAVAAMMLWEEGHFELTDPISKFIPSFADCRVYVKGTADTCLTVPVTEPVRIWHLLSHTAGLTYGFMKTHPVDEMYRRHGQDFGVPSGMDLAAACDDWASIPLLFQPGTEWNYSVGTDVIGRLIEVIAKMPLNEFLEQRIFQPLGMTETGFGTRADQQDRLAALYVPLGANKEATRFDTLGHAAKVHNPKFLSGGGGLVSTLHDYFRFQQVLRGRGEANGTRLLAPHTVKLMASNHLPGGADLESAGRPLFSETPYPGVGFGLAMSVTLNPAETRNAGSVGDYGWGGAASTWMLIDPVEDLTLTFMVQLLPSSTYQVRTQLKQAVYQALIN
jgi:CubicO group peptidase (beta-lactamase class C family)